MLSLPSNERERNLLQEVSSSLSQSQAALLAFDLASFESQTERQAEFCRQWQGLALDAGGRVSRQSLHALRQQLRIYSALLRRFRRTLEILSRAVAGSAGTYSIPPAHR